VARRLRRDNPNVPSVFPHTADDIITTLTGT
jgi:hypothetical protein